MDGAASARMPVPVVDDSIHGVTHTSAPGNGLPASLRWGTAIGATLLLAAASLLARRPMWLAAVILSALLLAPRVQRRRGWPLSLWFLIQSLVVAVLSEPAAVLLPGLLLALAHWDLAALDRRLRSAAAVYARRTLVRRHLGHLAVALAIGGGLGGIALSSAAQLSFAAAGALVIAALAGLTRLIRRD